MKKYVLLSTLFLSSISLFCQIDMGEIRLSKSKQATIMVRGNIEPGGFVSISDNVDIYSGEKKHIDFVFIRNSVILETIADDFKEKNISILTNDGIMYVGTLVKKDYIQGANLYNFSERQGNVLSIKEKKEIMEQDSLNNLIEVVDEKLKSVMNGPDKYNNIGEKNTGMIFQVTQIKNDDQFSYYKVVIENTTGTDYQVDGMYYRFEEDRKKRFSRDEEIKNKERFYAFHQREPEVVSAYSKNTVGYVIPLYMINESGFIFINLMERNGTRNCEIKIPVREILRSDVF